MTFQAGTGFDELGNRFGVIQHRQGLLERLEILRTHQERRRSAVACDYERSVRLRLLANPSRWPRLSTY